MRLRREPKPNPLAALDAVSDLIAEKEAQNPGFYHSASRLADESRLAIEASRASVFQQVVMGHRPSPDPTFGSGVIDMAALPPGTTVFTEYDDVAERMAIAKRNARWVAHELSRPLRRDNIVKPGSLDAEIAHWVDVLNHPEG